MVSHHAIAIKAMYIDNKGISQIAIGRLLIARQDICIYIYIHIATPRTHTFYFEAYAY